MIGTYTDGPEVPGPMVKNLSDGFEDDPSARRVEDIRLLGHVLTHELFASDIGREDRGADRVVVAIDRAGLAAVQPSAVGSEGDEVGEDGHGILR